MRRLIGTEATRDALFGNIRIYKTAKICQNYVDWDYKSTLLVSISVGTSRRTNDGVLLVRTDFLVCDAGATMQLISIT